MSILAIQIYVGNRNKAINCMNWFTGDLVSTGCRAGNCDQYTVALGTKLCWQLQKLWVDFTQTSSPGEKSHWFFPQVRALGFKCQENNDSSCFKCCHFLVRSNDGLTLEASAAIWSMSNFPSSPTRNITSHSMENLAFHSLLRLKDDFNTNSHYLT